MLHCVVIVEGRTHAGTTSSVNMCGMRAWPQAFAVWLVKNRHSSLRTACPASSSEPCAAMTTTCVARDKHMSTQHVLGKVSGQGHWRAQVGRRFAHCDTSVGGKQHPRCVHSQCQPRTHFRRSPNVPATAHWLTSWKAGDAQLAQQAQLAKHSWPTQSCHSAAGAAWHRWPHWQTQLVPLRSWRRGAGGA